MKDWFGRIAEPLPATVTYVWKRKTGAIKLTATFSCHILKNCGPLPISQRHEFLWKAEKKYKRRAKHEIGGKSEVEAKGKWGKGRRKNNNNKVVVNK